MAVTHVLYEYILLLCTHLYVIFAVGTYLINSMETKGLSLSDEIKYSADAYNM